MEQSVEERNKELLTEAAHYRDHWGTLQQMTEYYLKIAGLQKPLDGKKGE